MKYIFFGGMAGCLATLLILFSIEYLTEERFYSVLTGSALYIVSALTGYGIRKREVK